MQQPICNFAYLTAAVDDIEQVKLALTELCQQTLDEPACREFRFYQLAQENDKFVLHEIFEDQAAYQQHVNADYTQHFFKKNLVKVEKVVAVNALPKRL